MFFFFKRMTSYDVRISDWSSDVCSSDLLTLPYVALPLYWVFGRGKFHGYVAARRSGDLKIHNIAAALRERIEGGPRAILPPEAVALRVFEQLAGLPFTRSEERRVGKECVSPCRSRWSPYH